MDKKDVHENERQQKNEKHEKRETVVNYDDTRAKESADAQLRRVTHVKCTHFSQKNG